MKHKQRWIVVAAMAFLVTGGVLALLASQSAADDLKTDLERAAIPLDEVMSGGPPPQGIPALGFADQLGSIDSTDLPDFVSVKKAADWLESEEPVIVVEIGSEAKAYPIQVLMWHEIANDTVGGVPVAVTFCPLCNSALTFDRRVPLTKEQAKRVQKLDTSAELEDVPERIAEKRPDANKVMTVTFGTSGNLYQSNLLMFDSATHTLWSQAIGRGNVGTLTEVDLVRESAPIVSFQDFRDTHPDGTVMSRDTGFDRSYGRNPYVGYDKASEPPFLYKGENDDRLQPKERVVTFSVKDDHVAIPFALLEDEKVVEVEAGGEKLVVFWKAGTASALDDRTIAGGRDVGAVGVFKRVLDGKKLSFEPHEDGFENEKTGSVFDILGHAQSGELKGEKLVPVPHDNTLWFAWAAFRPETRVVTTP